MRENDVLVGNIKAVPPEGSLMPDTYKFARGTTRDQLIKTMQQEEKRVVADVWARRASDTPIRSPYELVTLASIVEKETGKPDERPRVAGVFINRLAKNIPLQSDPTIVYGLVGGKGTLGRGILKSEVDQKTPYNTYAIVGLPPGPIANPGKAALEAVAAPSRTKELYFVADGTGGHAFAETLDQHRANVLRWRQIEKDAKDKVTPDADKGGLPAVGAPSTTKTNQRGETDQGSRVYGVLGQIGAPPELSSGLGKGPAQFAEFPLSLSNPDAFQPAPKASSKDKRSGALARGSGQLDALDIELVGIPSNDGPAPGSAGFAEGAGQDNANPATLMTFPVSPARQAEMKARAAEYGLPAVRGGDGKVQAALEAPAPPLGQKGPTRIYDASEGTALDPLRDRTYDLNTAKSVPILKALPPLAAPSVN
jgi:UPF0755 protein